MSRKLDELQTTLIICATMIVGALTHWGIAIVMLAVGLILSVAALQAIMRG